MSSGFSMPLRVRGTMKRKKTAAFNDARHFELAVRVEGEGEASGLVELPLK